MTTKPGRRHYIDNLRWACILLLIPFHTAMAWNSWGEGNYIFFHGSRIASTFIIAIAPWFMPLMFVLAGISARFALKRRSYKSFFLERTKKLFLPLMIGLLTVIPFMTYLADRYNNGYTGNFWDHYAIFFTHITTFTGYDGAFTPAHLWFLLYLFVISVLSIGIIALQRRVLPEFTLARTGWPWLILPVLVLPFADMLLNIGGKSVVYDLVLFLLGYYLLSEEEVIARIAPFRFLLAGVTAAALIPCVVFFLWIQGASDLLWQIPMHVACWFGILALLGFGKTNLDKENRVTRYLSSRSFLFYIFHFGWLTLIQFTLSSYTKNTAVLVLGSIVGGYLLTFLWCEFLHLAGKASGKIFRRGKPVPAGK